MSLPNRIMTRRTFLKMIAQLPIFIAGLQTMDVTGVGLLRPSRLDTTYGSGAYGQGSYADSGYSIYLPIVNKEEHEHGTFTRTQ